MTKVQWACASIPQFEPSLAMQACAICGRGAEAVAGPVLGPIDGGSFVHSLCAIWSPEAS